MTEELKAWLEDLMELGKEIQDISDNGKSNMLPYLLGYIESAADFLKIADPENNEEIVRNIKN